MITTLRFAVTFLILHCCFSASAQLNGNYTINSGQPTGGTNFQTFTDFASSINASGVSGAVNADVVPGSGPYNEQVTFNNISGTGPLAIVTLNGNGETITALTDSTDRHVIRLTDIQHFTINNLRIERDTNSTSGFYGIHIYNTGSFINITNCAVYINGTTSTLAGAYVASGSTTSILATGDFNNISFVSDTATGGGYGVSVYGLVFPLAADILISNNVFYDFHSNGVYLRETTGAVVSNNYFDKRTSNVTSVNAIQVAQNGNFSTNIFNNFIKVSQTSNGTVTFRGIYLFNGAGHKVYNNVIHDVNLTSGNFTGIEVRTAGMASEIYFNTISVDNAGTSSGNLYGIKEELSSTNFMLRNNLISISQPTTGMKAGIVLGALTPVNASPNSNYNIIWVPNGNVALKNPTTPVLYPTLSDWQIASTQDSSSLSLDPMFTSASLPQPTNLAVDNAGIPIAGITLDVLGITRGVVPDIGAYEFPSTVDVAPNESIHRTYCFPNPFSDKLNVLLSNNEPSELILYNVLSGKQILLSFTNAVSLDTKALSDGIYFYEIRSRNKRVTTGKIVKQ